RLRQRPHPGCGRSHVGRLDLADRDRPASRRSRCDAKIQVANFTAISQNDLDATRSGGYTVMLRTVLSYPAHRSTLPGDHFGLPARLARADGAGSVLYVSGNAAIFAEERVVAIVGARAATRRGMERAGAIAAGLAGRALVLSGGAVGIDAAAHVGALGAGGLTAAVVAGGVTAP